MADRASVASSIVDHCRKSESVVVEISSILNDHISYVAICRNTSAIFYIGDHLYHQEVLYRQFLVSTLSNSITFHTSLYAICHTAADANYRSSAI